MHNNIQHTRRYKILNTTIRDIVYQAASFGLIEDALEVLEKDSTLRTVGGVLVSTRPESSAEAIDTVVRLVRCANLVLGEIAADYLPLSRRDILDSVQGAIMYSSFSRNLIDVRAVLQRGLRHKFRLRPDRVEVPSGRYEVEYYYLPPKYSLEDVIDYRSAVITARIIAYGVLAEYSIISGMQDDALLWDGRYRDALIGVSAGGSKRVRARKWE
jgi:hypothetical protein